MNTLQRAHSTPGQVLESGSLKRMEHLQKLSDKMPAETEDVKRVLAICFRTGASQTADDVERILSFDMGWMDTETAHNAIKALIFAGWIKDDGGLLSPNCDIRGIKAPLGWQPRPSRLTDPVVNGVTQPVEKEVETPKIPVVRKQKLLVHLTRIQEQE